MAFKCNVELEMFKCGRGYETGTKTAHQKEQDGEVRHDCGAGVDNDFKNAQMGHEWQEYRLSRIIYVPGPESVRNK